MRRQRDQHLRRGERVTKRVVTSVDGEAEVLCQFIERAPGVLLATLTCEKPTEFEGIEYRSAKSHALAAQRSTEKCLFDPADVSNDHSSGHCGDEWLNRFVERWRINEIDGSKSMDQNRRFV